MPALSLSLIIAAVAATGLLAGASLDQSVKQLPARHRMGVIAFSVYSRAADLGNGILYYAILGIGAALLSIAAAIAVWAQPVAASVRLPMTIAAALAILHSAATSQAAPTNFSQRRVSNDEAALTKIFTRFEFWQTIRVTLQMLNFGVLIWALVAAH